MKQISCFNRELPSIVLSTQSVHTTNRISMCELSKLGTAILVEIFRVIFHFDLFRFNSLSYPCQHSSFWVHNIKY